MGKSSMDRANENPKRADIAEVAVELEFRVHKGNGRSGFVIVDKHELTECFCWLIKSLL
jgi:hypothetical protein